MDFWKKYIENANISSACPEKMPTYLVLVGRREAALHRLRLRLFQFSEKLNRLRLRLPPPASASPSLVSSQLNDDDDEYIY